MTSFIVCAAILSACVASSRPPSAPGLPSGTRVVFPEEQVRAWRRPRYPCPQRFSPSDTSAWNIPPEVVELVDQRLAGDLLRALVHVGDTNRWAEEYHRQFAGVTCGGRALVSVVGAHLDNLRASAAARRLARQQPDTVPWREERFELFSHSGTRLFWAWYTPRGRLVRFHFDCCVGPALPGGR